MNLGKRNFAVGRPQSNNFTSLVYNSDFFVYKYNFYLRDWIQSPDPDDEGCSWFNMLTLCNRCSFEAAYCEP